MKEGVVVVLDGNAVEKDLASRRFVEVLEHSDAGGLATTRRSNERDDFSGFGDEGQILKNRAMINALTLRALLSKCFDLETDCENLRKSFRFATRYQHARTVTSSMNQSKL